MRLIMFLAPIILITVKLIIMKFKHLIENESEEFAKGQTERWINAGLHHSLKEIVFHIGTYYPELPQLK